MSRICTTTDTELHGFSPFDDSYEQSRIGKIVHELNNTEDGMNTTAIDPYRQGVEIINDRMYTLGMQPKIWSGNICGFTRLNTYGQFENYVEFTGDTKFDDEKSKFNPMTYMENYDSYPYNLEFNDGPAQQYETALEPLTIPFRFNTNEDPKKPAHGVYGSYGDVEGYEITQLQQYFDLTTDLSSEHCNWFFLDYGGRYFGDGPLNEQIVYPGYISYDVDCIIPFDDTRANSPNNPLIKQLTSASSDLIQVLMSSSMDINLDDDLRHTYTNRSTTAGWSVYGPKENIYGTNSIAFNGFMRGS